MPSRVLHSIFFLLRVLVWFQCMCECHECFFILYFCMTVHSRCMFFDCFVGHTHAIVDVCGAKNRLVGVNGNRRTIKMHTTTSRTNKLEQHLNTSIGICETDCGRSYEGWRNTEREREKDWAIERDTLNKIGNRAILSKCDANVSSFHLVNQTQFIPLIWCRQIEFGSHFDSILFPTFLIFLKI